MEPEKSVGKGVIQEKGEGLGSWEAPGISEARKMRQDYGNRQFIQGKGAGLAVESDRPKFNSGLTSSQLKLSEHQSPHP